MKKSIFSLLLLTVTFLGACTDYETYGELKEKERDAISQFIKDSAINVISETVFTAQDYSTDLTRNEFRQEWCLHADYQQGRRTAA